MAWIRALVIAVRPTAEYEGSQLLNSTTLQINGSVFNFLDYGDLLTSSDIGDVLSFKIVVLLANNFLVNNTKGEWSGVVENIDFAKHEIYVKTVHGTIVIDMYFTLSVARVELQIGDQVSWSMGTAHIVEVIDKYGLIRR